VSLVLEGSAFGQIFPSEKEDSDRKKADKNKSDDKSKSKPNHKEKTGDSQDPVAESQHDAQVKKSS
jgi:hypothetical protein